MDMQLYPMPNIIETNAELEIIHGPTLGEAFRHWSKTVHTPLLLTYSVSIPFALDWLENNPHLQSIHVLADYRARHHWAYIAHNDRRVAARSWSWNRTMHAKLLVDQATPQAWLTSANFSAGSHNTALNFAAIIRSNRTAHQLREYFHTMWRYATPIPPNEDRPQALAWMKPSVR